MKECPNCSTRLVPFLFAGIQLERCVDCAGIWFDAEEMRRAKAASPQAWEVLDAQVEAALARVVPNLPRASKACPLCREPMQPYQFLSVSGIWLNECSNRHGHWVDDGELAAMLKYLEQAQQSDERLPVKLIAANAQMDAEIATAHGRAGAIGAFCSALMTRIPWL